MIQVGCANHDSVLEGVRLSPLKMAIVARPHATLLVRFVYLLAPPLKSKQQDIWELRGARPFRTTEAKPAGRRAVSQIILCDS